MEKFADMSLDAFTAALASKEAVPGGGGAAGLAGALAAALGAMVCNLTSGKKKYAEYEADIAAALEKLELTRKYMLRLVDEDAKAFQPLQKYLSLPKDDPERAAHMDSALRVACFIPLRCSTPPHRRRKCSALSRTRARRAPFPTWASASNSAGRQCAPRGSASS